MKNITQRSTKRLSGSCKFLFCILGLYSGIALTNPILILKSLKYFTVLITKVLPILALVFTVLLLTNMFLNPERIKKYLGTDSGLRGWFYAIIGGIFISGPPYMLFPMLGELKKHGARNGLLATMLYNRNVKIYFIPAIIYYFGLRYTLVLSSYIILFSLLNGKLVEFFVNNKPTQ